MLKIVSDSVILVKISIADHDDARRQYTSKPEGKFEFWKCD
jgi:hypothetical protein